MPDVCPYAKEQPVRTRDPVGGGYYYQRIFLPCGKCYICRKAKVNSWISRLLAETKTCDHCHFLTLTYDDDHLPFSEHGVPSVSYEHLQKYLKRLRKLLITNENQRIRYFATAEYGGRFQRPHYHLLLFCSGIPKDVSRQAFVDKWPHGFVYRRGVGLQSIRYCANFHVHKSSTPEGAYPSFTRQSRRPGLGGLYLDSKIDQFRSLTRRFTVFDGSRYPFGRYYHDRYEKNPSVVPHSTKYDLWEEFLKAYPTEQDALDAREIVDFKMKLVNKRHNKF